MDTSVFFLTREVYSLSFAVIFSRLMRIDHCELVLVDVVPVGKASAVTPQQSKTQVT